MPRVWNRRAALTGLAAGAIGGLTLPAWALDQSAGAPETPGAGAEYGWATIDLAGRSAALNPDLRLPMCSTFKWLLTACVLSRIDAGLEQLRRPLTIGPQDILFNSPTVEAAVQAAGGQHADLSIEALCQASITLSDNAAANALLSTIGGPPALTAWLRSQGDAVTRLDRKETELNHVPRGDPRDTTTPVAMLGDLQRILYGNVLQADSRRRLFDWMRGCKTGDSRLRAGLPRDWTIAHKTGTFTLDAGHAPGERAACGDVGVLIPPVGQPILIAAYTAGSERPQAEIDRWFANLSRRIAAAHLVARLRRRNSTTFDIESVVA